MGFYCFKRWFGSFCFFAFCLTLWEDIAKRSLPDGNDWILDFSAYGSLRRESVHHELASLRFSVTATENRLRPPKPSFIRWLRGCEDAVILELHNSSFIVVVRNVMLDTCNPVYASPRAGPFLVRAGLGEEQGTTKTIVPTQTPQCVKPFSIWNSATSQRKQATDTWLPPNTKPHFLHREIVPEKKKSLRGKKCC